MRQACLTPLVKPVHLTGGKQIIYPYLVYCYLGVNAILQNFLSRPGFLSPCEEWRYKPTHTECFEDVYDGNIWKEFQTVCNIPFLAKPCNFALAMNMDFFQPYKHIKGYSVGAIYCVILNLPREIRYKRENVLLIGVIPGPKEPDHDINSFLNPFVEDLQTLWSSGKNMIADGKNKLVKCALLCVVCDVPAGHKTCGFLGHAAHYGCSKCFKKFSGSAGKIEYIGFDRENWPSRNGVSHRRVAMGMHRFSTLHEQESMEIKSGLRYSSLVLLPYFDAPRMLIIDPMHNLFFGTAKMIFQNIWLNRGILTPQSFEVIQERVDSIVVPPGIGRIPHKIKSGFSSFTADHWKNWTLYFSLIALHDILDDDDLECWRHFVFACRLLCQKSLKKEKLNLGDLLLLQFCRRAERMYGTNSVTPNMHFHCHLKDCVKDYGLLHSFWLYAFERYNGILENFPNNNRSIECQLMKRFLTDSESISIELPSDFSEKFKPHFMQTSLASNAASGSLEETISPTCNSQEATLSWEYSENMILPSSRSRYILNSSELNHLKDL